MSFPNKALINGEKNWCSRRLSNFGVISEGAGSFFIRCFRVLSQSWPAWLDGLGKKEKGICLGSETKKKFR